MRRPRPPVFLERRSYRQRRLRDAAQLLPLLGLILWVLPLLFGADGTPAPTSRTLLYIFGVWVGLVVAAAALARALDPVDPTDDSEGPGAPVRHLDTRADPGPADPLRSGPPAREV